MSRRAAALRRRWAPETEDPAHPPPSGRPASAAPCPGAGAVLGSGWSGRAPGEEADVSTEDDVGRLAAVLPEVSEKPCYGRPGFYVAGKIFARLHEQPGVLVCWLPGLDDKEALLAADPEVFFTTDHYRGHASVLVRLERIGTPELEELLRESWSCRAPRQIGRAHV